jgi:hypothetical protein
MRWRGPLPDRSEDWDWQIDPDHMSAQGQVLFAGGRFPKSKLCQDSSLYGNHGALTNMEPTDCVWDSTLNRYGLSFGGTNEYVDHGSPKSLDIINDITLLTWFDIPAGGPLLGKWFSTSNLGYLLFSFAANSMTFQVDGSTNRASAAYLYNTLTHVAGVRRGTGIEIWINGKLIATDTATTLGVAAIQCFLGRYAGAYLTGKLFDPTIYNRALSVAEIQQDADPVWSIDRGGLIYADRKWWPGLGPTGAPPTFKAAWAIRQRKTIGAGVL